MSSLLHCASLSFLKDWEPLSLSLSLSVALWCVGWEIGNRICQMLFSIWLWPLILVNKASTTTTSLISVFYIIISWWSCDQIKVHFQPCIRIAENAMRVSPNTVFLLCYFNLNLTSEGTILVEVIERFSMTVELAWIRCQEDPDNIQTYKK